MKPLQAAAVGVAALLAVGLAAAQPLAAERPTRHALIIGIGQYQDPEVPSLRGTRHDMVSAQRMAAAMAIPQANIRLLRDREATAERIRAEITALEGRVQDGDRVFIYYSGHGTRWYDAKLKIDGCTEGLLAADGGVLSNVEMGQRLAPLARRSDKMLVFYDACFSGGVAATPLRTRGFQMGSDVITPKFTPVGGAEQCAQPRNFRSRGLALVLQQAQALPQNVVHIAAARPDEASFDSSAIGGFATASWRDCLLGEAQDLDGSGAITADEVTRCAQAKITRALAGQPGVLGQQMTVAGNPAFVPAWMGAAFGTAAAAATSTSTPTLAAAPVATPADILAELHAQRDGNRGVTAAVRKAQLKIGSDALEIDIRAQRDGYLYIAQAGSDGQSLTLLYPNALAADNRVRAGQSLALPGPAAKWEVVAGGPPGTETVLVMVTDTPRNLAALAQEKAGPFMKTLLDGQGRSRLQWVLSNGAPGCVRANAAGCSDAFGAALLKVQSVP